MESEPTRVLLAVSESTIRGYPHASISSRGAFEWTIQKIVRSNTSGFRLHFLHVQVPNENVVELKKENKLVVMESAMVELLTMVGSTMVESTMVEVGEICFLFVFLIF
ncbi:hypothetical protein EZV62_019601 [Acer yangbiense]|uniref:Uncharacterized protein n=1 Tax=Acer yangbiense TaxID=1000413 RepID=A0A5C7HCN9_9ROSI|nr:hypothetical protein EZV62_019601 [Acer yangbiense]